MSRRLEERAVEAEADSKDRCAEKQELQRLKDKLYADSSYADPAAEFERVSIFFLRQVQDVNVLYINN